MAYICIKFYTGLKTILHKQFWCQNSIPAKSKMAAAAILKFTLMATTQSLSNIFVQNLAQRLKRTPRKQFYLQISLLRKSKMVAAAILKIGLKGYCKIIWLGPPFRRAAIPRGRHSETAPFQGALTPEARLTPTYCNHDKTVRQTVFISIQFLL